MKYKNRPQIVIGGIDSAVSFSTCEIHEEKEGEEYFKFGPADSDYKTIAFISGDDDHYAAYCSKDGHEYSICVGAFKGDKPIDLIFMTNLIDSYCQEIEEIITDPTPDDYNGIYEMLTGLKFNGGAT